MKISHLSDYVRGWFVGAFTPAAYTTDAAEIGILSHRQGEAWPTHYHTTTEINCMISGTLELNGTRFTEGDIFIIEPFEHASVTFITDCKVLVIKIPGKLNDKYIVETTQ